MKQPLGAQKSWLTAAKRSLSKIHSDLTWDDFARLAGIEPRALKSYRMPETSADYRTMPSLARQAIEALLAKLPGNEDAAEDRVEVITLGGNDLLIPALAALVCRQANISLIEGRMIAGVDKRHGMPIGLTSEDRRAMGLVSRCCLRNGLPDYGAEIHELLYRCTLPFGEWMTVDEVSNLGLANVCLINAEAGVPTSEAEELAANFSGITASVEEQLFAKFIETLGRNPESSANQYYTDVREFIVRHPMCTPEALKVFAATLPGPLWVILQQHFYEPVPEAWEVGGAVPICTHCGNAMMQGKMGLVCRTTACVMSHSANAATFMPAASLLRITRGIRQYWVEPGIDEIRLYDALVDAGLEPKLYPNRDRVDIAVGEIGMDLKTYSSPETLGMRFRRGIGGLAHYSKKWVVVPDWQVASTPSYLDRLRTAADRPEIEFLSLSDALSQAVRLKKAHHA